jgi:hypothetical protein
MTLIGTNKNIGKDSLCEWVLLQIAQFTQMNTREQVAGKALSRKAGKFRLTILPAKSYSYSE